MCIFSTLPAAQEQDKPLLFTLIKYLYALSEKVRRYGILSLEEELDGEHITVAGGKQPFAAHPVLEGFVRRLVQLVTDGHDGELIADIARYSLASSAEDDGTNLACMIATEGIVAVQKGLNPESMRLLLSSMLGVRAGEEFLAATEEKDFLLEFLEFPPLPDEAEWEKRYGKEWARLVEERMKADDIPFGQIALADDATIQMLLRCIDSDELVSALIPPNAKDVRDAVFRNLSERAVKNLRCDMIIRYPYTAEHLFEMQRTVASTYRRLLKEKRKDGE